MFPVYCPGVVRGGTVTVTVQGSVWSLEEAGKLNEPGDVETHEATLPVTTGAAVKASLFLGSVTLWVKWSLFPGAIAKVWAEGL